jgi:hypothetical protein
MAAKSAALLFSYLYSSLAALICSRRRVLGSFFEWATALLWSSESLGQLLLATVIGARQLQCTRTMKQILFIMQNTLRLCKLLFTAMLVLLSLWARSKYEATQLYFDKFYFDSTAFPPLMSINIPGSGARSWAPCAHQAIACVKPLQRTST